MLGTQVNQITDFTQITDFILRQHAHVHDSIKLADQKGQAIIAISAAFFYLVIELTKNTKRPSWSLTIVSTLTILMLVSSGGLALWAIYPPTGIADRDVVGGWQVRPDPMMKHTQQEVTDALLNSTDRERAEYAAALLYARARIRDWKLTRFKWSVYAIGVASLLLASCVLMSNFHKMKRSFQRRRRLVAKKPRISPAITHGIARTHPPGRNSISQVKHPDGTSNSNEVLSTGDLESPGQPT